MRRPCRLFLAALLLATLAPRVQAEPAADAEHYLDRFIDPSVDPRNDFFHYSVGKWLRENPIPAAERSWGIASVIQEETYHRLVGINETASADKAAPRGSNAQKKIGRAHV